METRKVTERPASGPSQAVSPDGFRHLMAGFPTGVAVVTATGADGRPHGMTCSSLCAVCLDPPTLLVSLRRGSPTLESALSGSGFTVNLVHAGAQATAALFASGAPDRFAKVRWYPAPRPGGPRLPDDARAIADCRVSHVVPVGDHTVIFGEVYRLESGDGEEPRRPLLYGLRRYAAWPE